MNREDARAKVTGRARYTGDWRPRRMLVAKLWRSPLPHARIGRIDVAAALAIPGVRAVIGPGDVADLGRFGHAIADRAVLPGDKVRFLGEPVVAVAAEDAESADAALQAIHVELEALPTVLDAEAALSPDAVWVHEDAGAGNLCALQEISRGDVDSAFRQAFRVYEDRYTFPSVYQYAMEPHIVVARANRRDLVIWSATQHPYTVRRALADMFHRPMARVRVVASYLGGGFGSKAYVKAEPIAVALALKTGRPVGLEFSVGEAMLTERRHGATLYLKTAVDATGRITARQGRVYLDTGAYADNGPRVASRACSQLIGPYPVENYHVQAFCVYTTKSPSGSYRAIGKPQALWAGESQLDTIALDLGMAPEALRAKNLARRGDVLRSKETPMDADLRDDLEQLQAFPGVAEGAGVACGTAEAGSGRVAEVLVRWHGDGSATVQAGSVELGQGCQSTLAQIAARELGIPAHSVSVRLSDTDGTVFDHGTGSSRTTTMMGRAVIQACGKLKADREARGAEVPEELLAVGSSLDDLPERFPIFWETAMGAAEVSLDEETGEVRVLAYTSLADIGTAIDSERCDDQDTGSVVQGLGHTLFEEMVWDSGNLVNNSLVDYRVPGFRDIPAQLEAIFIENYEGLGPYGAKGMGEGAIVPVAPAIASALRRRYQLSLQELPLTPERVWQALKHREAPNSQSS